MSSASVLEVLGGPPWGAASGWTVWVIRQGLDSWGVIYSYGWMVWDIRQSLCLELQGVMFSHGGAPQDLGPLPVWGVTYRGGGRPQGGVGRPPVS